jgi:Ca2+-binding RTX toxin-like protein
MFETAVNGRFAIAEEFQVGSNSFQTQSDVSFASLTDGGFVAVWMGEDGFNDSGVRAQIFNNDGRPVGPEFSVNLSTSGVQAEPSVIALPSGGFIVTWSDESAGYPDVFDIHGQIFDTEGQRVGDEFIVNSTTAGFQVNSEITWLADGGFVVTWENPNDYSADDIRAQVFSADGTKIGVEIVVSDAQGADKGAPTITALADGGFVIGWTEFGGVDTRAQLFDFSGNKVGSAFPLNSFTVGYQQSPALAALPSGGFVAAYADNGLDSLGSSTGHAGIWIQLFDANGNKIGGEIHASAGGSNGQGVPVIEIIQGTGFMVVWKDGSGSGGSDEPSHVNAQMFDLSGNKIGAEFSLDSTPGQSQNVPDVAYLSNGALVVGWQDLEAPSYNDLDVRARMLFPITHGTIGNDTLVGGAGRDFVMGEAGDDLIQGGAEDDGLGGGDGNDTLNGGDGNDGLDGNAGSDVLDGGAGFDILTGGDGNDTLQGGADNDLLDGGAGGDTLDGGTGSDTLKGGIGNDALDGGDDGDELYGEAGDDTLIGGAGADRLNGGDGADTLRGGAEGDIYEIDAFDIIIENPDEGIDFVSIGTSYTLGANLENLSFSGSASADGTGNDLENHIAGNSGNNVLRGLGGNDGLSGNAGNDSLDGGEGNDWLSGGNDSDIIAGGQGDDILSGGMGNDVFVYRTGDGQDTISDLAAGEAINIYGYTSAQSVTQVGGNVVVLFASGNQITVENSTVATVDAALHFMDAGGGGSITGTAGNDTLNGTAENDTISGLGGNDVLNGGAGSDTMDGGVGNDTMNGGPGDDLFYVDNARDRVTELSGQGTDEVRTSVTYTLASNVENASAQGATAINLTGNSGANVLTGNAAANTLNGNGGNDTLIGGLGNDVLTGGLGSDVFKFTDVTSGNDRITDFRSGQDKIDLHAFGISAAQVSAVVSGRNLILNIDADHNGATDFTITLTNITHLNSSDYIF